MAQGKRGRPKKLPIDQRIASELDVAQQEINSLMPPEQQAAFLPAIQVPEVIVEPAPKITKDARDDYEFARNNLHNLLERGNTVLDGIVALTEESDHPRTFEVAGVLLKVLLEGTRELMTLQKDIREVEKKSVVDTNSPVNIENAGEVTNNTMVIEGTTMEMLDMLQKMRQEKLEQQNKD
jgi:hypothetical protein